MKTNNWLFALTIFALFFAACTKEDPSPQLDKSEGKLVINTSQATVISEIALVKQHEGLKALEDFQAFSELIDVDLSVDKKLGLISGKKSLSEVKSILQKKNEDDFSLSGTLTYNPVSQSFDFEYNVPTDRILIKYPVNGSTTNNATLTMYNSVSHETETSYTTELLIDITVNNVIKLKSSLIISTTESELKTESTLEIDPYKITSSSTFGDSETVLAQQILKSGVSLLKKETKLNFDSEDSFSGDIYFYIQKGAAYIEGTFDSAVMNGASPEKSMYKLVLYTYPGAIKIGDVYKTKTGTFVIYSDGTEEDITPFTQDSGDIITDIFENSLVSVFN